MQKLAPIILFTYNRLWHTQQTIESLQKNELAKDSELYIYSDAGKDEKSWQEVNEVRRYLKVINGFKKIRIIEQTKNLGLADSIISGVTKIINKYEKVIVLEDDIVTSPYFLSYMNHSLTYYEKEKKVWHVGGWNYPIKSVNNNNEAFLFRVMNCWGWATWKDKWKYFEKDPNKLIQSFTKEEIYKFNLDGTHDFWSQVILNKNNKINTWAIFWYATIFKNKGLCLNPIKSLTSNIGFDGSGLHCGDNDTFNVTLNNNIVNSFPKKVNENEKILDKIKFFYWKNSYENIPSSIKNFASKLRKLHKNISNLKKDKYLIYGAGTGCELILSKIEVEIVGIIDSTIKDSIKWGKPIISSKELSKYNDYKILISVFDQQDDISNFLEKECNINNENILFLI